MKFQRVRINEPGWDKYTGVLSGVEFTNGISDQPIPDMIMDQLGAVMRVVALDDDVQVGAAQSLKVAMENNAAVVVDELQKGVSETPQANADEPTEGEEESTEEGYTLESLEAIADKRGIAGVREVATPMSVTGRSIAELIRGILEHQKNS